MSESRRASSHRAWNASSSTPPSRDESPEGHATRRHTPLPSAESPPRRRSTRLSRQFPSPNVDGEHVTRCKGTDMDVLDKLNEIKTQSTEPRKPKYRVSNDDDCLMDVNDESLKLADDYVRPKSSVFSCRRI